MNKGKIACFHELGGWRLNFALLRLTGDYAPPVLKLAVEGSVERFRRTYSFESIAANEVVQAFRCLRGYGCNNESSAEVLARKVLGGGSIPLERPAEVFKGILCLKSLAPWSVMDYNKLSLPLTFRIGGEEDIWDGPEKNLNLRKYPVISDAKSVVASPVIVDDGLLVEAECPEILLVCYAPAAVAREVDAKGHLGRLVHMTRAYRFIEERAFLPGKTVQED